MLSVAQRRRAHAKSDRARFEPVWQLCQAFLANKQWVGWSRRDRRVIDDPNPRNEERHTVNVLMQYATTVLGKTLPDEELPRLLARSPDAGDEAFARYANLLMQYIWQEELQAEQRLYEARWKRVTYGIAGIMPRYDTTVGPILRDVPHYNGETILDKKRAFELLDQGANLQMKSVRSGRPCWDILSPFNILPPPGIEYERDFPWLIVERAVPLDMLRRLYGKKVDGLESEDLSAVDALNLRPTGVDLEDPQTNSGRLREHVLVSTMYEMPTEESPDGRMVIFAGDRLLDSENALPYQHKGEPVIGIRFLKYWTVPGRFWPVGPVELGLGPQRQRNRSRTQWIAIKDRSLGRVYARPGSLQASSSPVGKAMEVIEVKMGHDYPTETQGAGPGPWIQQDIEMHDNDLQQAMGMGDASLGRPQSGITAYAALAQQAEQDDKRIGPIIKADRMEIAELVKCTLQDCRRYWTSDKLISIASENGMLDEFTFEQAKLPDDVYVYVGSGAPAPRNQAAEVQLIFDLFDRSVSSGQTLPLSWLYESLRAGKAKALPANMVESQREKAEMENHLIAMGVMLEPSPIDNHQLHITIHDSMISELSLVPQAAQTVALLQQHRMLHERMMAMQQQAPGANAPMLQGPQGQLGGAPTPGAPQAAG